MNQIFYIFDHDEREYFQIVGIENFIAWLNDSSDSHTFDLNGFDELQKITGFYN